VPIKTSPAIDRLLSVTLIDNAMKGNDFWLKPDSLSACIVAHATRAGYVRRISHTQIEWTHEGLAKARAEIKE
jgi:hypothetical protein